MVIIPGIQRRYTDVANTVIYYPILKVVQTPGDRPREVYIQYELI